MFNERALKKLTGQKIALLGWGLDNQALHKWLKTHRINAEITIKDAKADPTGFNQNLENFDLLFRSPGWPLFCPGIKTALKKGQTTVTSPLNLFFTFCPTKNIIGVTGSKGKGTTATLISRLLKASGKKVWLGGNIGVSPLTFLDKIKPTDYVVLELSSFQLEDLNFSPQISVITNLYPEHLAPADPNNPNFHSSLTKYWKAKLNIANQKSNRYLVVNQKLKTKLKGASLPGKIVYFSANPLTSGLAGIYNQENIGAALEVARLLKIKPAISKKVVANFTNLEHRLEFVKKIKGVNYYDNSFSTTPESTDLDLKSFSKPIIQIAGGADKGASFQALAKTIKEKVRFLILLPGKATPKIKQELEKINFPKNKLLMASNMEIAVQAAKDKAEPGDVVLLSTACASFGIFKNYKERGDLFKKYVRR